jgi:hypothetical protein
MDDLPEEAMRWGKMEKLFKLFSTLDPNIGFLFIRYYFGIEMDNNQMGPKDQ